MAEVQKLMVRFGVPPGDFLQVSRGSHYSCWWKLNGHTFCAQVEGGKVPEHELRRKWRVIVNHIKAQLISVDEGLIGKEEALLPFLMLPDGTNYAPEFRAHLKSESKIRESSAYYSPLALTQGVT